MTMIKIDGSQGEGGGQIVRSALALSCVTGGPFEITNIRGKRKRPGLLRQHLTAVNAAREICSAGVTGAELYSSQLIFAPGEIQTREFKFRIGTAGSTTLVAQTVIPALMIADRPSRIIVEGGTHNMAAPPYDFLDQVYLPQLSKLGPVLTRQITAYGFYPVGGGRIVIDINPSENLEAFELVERGGKPVPSVTALVSKLPRTIGDRECDVIRGKSKWKSARFEVKEIENSPGPGNVVMIRLTSPNVTEMFTGFGKRGFRAEDVARGVYREAKAYLNSGVPVGEYLADQLLLPLGLAASQGHTCRFRTSQLSLHSQTHVNVLKLFLDINVEVTDVGDGVCEIVVGPQS